MTRVLYLAPSGQVGGAERCLLSLAAGLDRGQFAPQVLIGSPGPFQGLLSGAGIATSTVPLPPGLRQLSSYNGRAGGSAGSGAAAAQLPGYLWRLRRAQRQAHADIVHSNGTKMHYLAALAGGRRRAPLLWHLHDFPRRLRGLNALAGRVAMAVANSQAVAAAYAERFPALAGKLRVIPNGVNVAAMRSGSRAAFRTRWKLPAEAPVIGMVAIFAPWKGQEIFLRAAQRVRQRIPEARFLLIGDDIYDTAGHGGRRAQLEHMAASLGLGDAVHFTGFLERDLPSAYAALDVLVHASTEPEPFGRTAIEAMAASTAVVAAGAGGMLEVIEDGASGRLTPPGDAAALAEALIELAEAPSLRARLVEAGLARVSERFSEGVVARQWEALYRELSA